MKIRLLVDTPIQVVTPTASYCLDLRKLQFDKSKPPTYYLGAEDLNPVAWLRQRYLFSESLGPLDEAKKSLKVGIEVPPVDAEFVKLADTIVDALEQSCAAERLD